MNLFKSFDSNLVQYMRKAACPLGGMKSSNPRRWRGEWLHHHGGGVCWLFVLLWMDSWCHELNICKKWYKNNLKMWLMHYFLIHVGMHHTWSLRVLCCCVLCWTILLANQHVEIWSKTSQNGQLLGIHNIKSTTKLPKCNDMSFTEMVHKKKTGLNILTEMQFWLHFDCTKSVVC